MHGHQQGTAWPQGHQRLRDDLCVGRKPQLVPRQNRRQDELRLSKGELIADTQAWATPKGKVGKAGAICRALSGKPFWVELIGPLPVARMPVRHILE